MWSTERIMQRKSENDRPQELVYIRHNIHKILRKRLCSNRIAIIPEKSEYVCTERENTAKTEDSP